MFKTLTSILKKEHAHQGVSFQAGELVVGVWEHGRCRKLPATPWENIECPMCHQKDGHRVFDVFTKEVTWSCRSEKCTSVNINKAAPRPKRISGPEILRISGVPKFLHHASFEDWRHPEGQKNDLIEWASNPTGSCILSGEKGVGKTYMAACVIVQAKKAKALSSYFMDVIETKYKWLDEMQSSKPKSLCWKMTNCDLLIIDDIDKVNPSDAFYEFLYLVINSRYGAEKSTVITTNLGFDELHARVGDAIASRLFSTNGLFVEVEGQDLRQQ